MVQRVSDCLGFRVLCACGGESHSQLRGCILHQKLKDTRCSEVSGRREPFVSRQEGAMAGPGRLPLESQGWVTTSDDNFVVLLRFGDSSSLLSNLSNGELLLVCTD